MNSILVEPSTRKALLITGSAFLLFLAAFGLFVLAGRNVPDSALVFVGFVLVSILGLALAAAVFKALGFTTNTDAFGLPSGSIRAVIAISIMVMFVLFGLPFIQLRSAPTRLADKPFETVTVPCAAVANEVNRFRSIGVVGVPDLAACAPQAGGTAGAAVAGIATLKLYSTTQEYSSEQLEFGKQILTAVITLLTTIIGFYFGSQSALAAVGVGQTALGNAGANAPAPPPGPGPQNGDGGTQVQVPRAFDAAEYRGLGQAAAELSETASTSTSQDDVDRSADDFKARWGARIGESPAEPIRELGSQLLQAIDEQWGKRRIGSLARQLADEAIRLAEPTTEADSARDPFSSQQGRPLAET